jgi:hypothetical protein
MVKIFCEKCNYSIHEGKWPRHIQGRRHVNGWKRDTTPYLEKEKTWCQKCEKFIYNSFLEDHLKGRRHNKVDPKVYPRHIKEHCSLCNVDYQKGRAHQHINSLKHRRNIKWECTVCFLTFTIIGKQRHLTTKGHLEKLKRIDKKQGHIEKLNRVVKKIKAVEKNWDTYTCAFKWMFPEPKEKSIKPKKVNWFKEFIQTIKNSK